MCGGGGGTPYYGLRGKGVPFLSKMVYKRFIKVWPWGRSFPPPPPSPTYRIAKSTRVSYHPNFTFYGERKQATVTFYFSFLTWKWSLGFQRQEGSPTFDKVGRKLR